MKNLNNLIVGDLNQFIEKMKNRPDTRDIVNGNVTVPSDEYPTIQSAINAYSDGNADF